MRFLGWLAQNVPGVSFAIAGFSKAFEDWLKDQVGAQDLPTYINWALVFTGGMMLGALWSYTSKNWDQVQRRWGLLWNPVELYPVVERASNQEGLQNGQARLLYGGLIENTSRRLQRGVCMRITVCTSGAEDEKEFCYELPKLHGRKQQFVPAVEVICKDGDCMKTAQYRFLPDMHNNSTELAHFETSLKIGACLASDGQPEYCSGEHRLCTPATDSSMSLQINEIQGFGQ